MGAADGSIIATIMISHMTKFSMKYAAGAEEGAIGPPSISMSFMPIAAMDSSQRAIATVSRQSQRPASATSSARQPPTIHRSRRSARSSARSDMARAGPLDDAVRRHVQVVEVGMRVGERQLDRPVCSRAPARVFRLMIFEPLWQMHADAMLISGDGVTNGLDRRVDDAGDAHAADSPFQVEIEFNRRENRVVHLGERWGEHVEDRRARRGLVPREYGQERVALRVVRVVADDDERLAVSEMNRPGPSEHAAERQATQIDVSEMPLVDLDRGHRPAVAMGRQRIELTGTPEVAVAVGD